MKLVSVIAAPKDQAELDQLALCCAAQTLSADLELCCGLSFSPRPTKQPIRVKVVMAPASDAKRANAALDAAEGEYRKLLVAGALLKSDALELAVKATEMWSLCSFVPMTGSSRMLVEPELPKSAFTANYPRPCMPMFKAGALRFDEQLPTLWLAEWSQRMLSVFGPPALVTRCGVCCYREFVADDFRERAALWKRMQSK